MKIGIYVYDNVEELDFVGPYEVLSYVNKIKENSLEVFLISSGEKEIKAFNGLKFHADKLINEVRDNELDILIIPGGKGRKEEAGSEEIKKFINRIFANLTLLASVCTGAFFLGEAGFLEGKKAITHKNAVEELQEKYKVTIIEEKVVKNDKVWLSGGVSSGINLSLEIIKEYFGEDMVKKVKVGIEYQQ